MKSIATTLFEDFGVTPKYRPVPMEPIIVGLITTLAKHGYLQEAVDEIESNTDMTYDGNLPVITTIAESPLLPFMYKNPLAASLYVAAMPFMHKGESYVQVPYYYNGDRRNLINAIDYLNTINTDFTLLLLPNNQVMLIGSVDPLYVIDVLQENNVSMPIRDRVLSALQEPR